MATRGNISMREKETGKWRDMLQKNGFFDMPSLIFQLKKAVELQWRRFSMLGISADY